MATVSVALAMGLHPRLGIDSPLRVLPVDLIRRIALLNHLQSTQWVVAITVRSGLLIDAISMHYSDGTSRTVGGLGGFERPLFRLSPGEYIVKVVARHGDYLDAISFETSLGRKSAMFGGQGGKPFVFDYTETSYEIFALEATTSEPYIRTPVHHVRPAPRPEWRAEIALLRLHGFASQDNFFSRVKR